MAHSPHRRHKGCALCKPNKHRDLGQAHRQPLAALRAVGRARRIRRHELGDHTDG
jgi:hypothetical protein